MEPTFKEGSFFIASSIPFWFRKPSPGDLILFEYNGKTIFKKITKFENGKYFTEGQNKLDSKEFPPLPINKILGKAIIKI